MTEEEYKDALLKTIKDIEENIDNIIEYGFSKSTTGIEISLNIEPGEIIGWNCKYHHTTSPLLSYCDKKERNNE